jgi:hypothetical protein
LTKLAVGERLGEDAVVDEAEGVPFGGAFSFEVPEYPIVLLVVAFVKCQEKLL